MSEQKSIAVVDATTMEWAVSSAGPSARSSAKVCGGKLCAVAAADVKTDDGSVLAYDTVKRSDMTTADAPPDGDGGAAAGHDPSQRRVHDPGRRERGRGQAGRRGRARGPCRQRTRRLATYAVRVDFAGLAATDRTWRPKASTSSCRSRR